jgi:hypothetical protein
MPRHIRSSHVHPCHCGTPPSGGHTAAIDATATRSPTVESAHEATQAQAPNPLLAINIGMGFFFSVAALVVVLS